MDEEHRTNNGGQQVVICNSFAENDSLRDSETVPRGTTSSEGDTQSSNEQTKLLYDTNTETFLWPYILLCNSDISVEN